MYSRYILWQLAAMLVLSLVLLPCWLFLQRSGELLSDAEIAEAQTAGDEFVLAGMATRPVDYHYKLELVRRRQPEVVALGSSRALPFRPQFFLPEFVNAGQGMGNIGMGQWFVSEMLETCRPAVVLLAVDIWWINRYSSTPFVVPQPLSRGKELSVKKLLLPYVWVRDKKISAVDLLSGGLFQREKNRIGVAALTTFSGLGPWGSYYYTGIITGTVDADDVRFGKSIDRVRQGTSKFEYAVKADESKVATLISLIERLEQAGCHVVAFLPPVAPTVHDEMQRIEQGGGYSYVADAMQTMEQAGIVLHDYQDVRSLGSSDGEFVDGFHGGDVAYARILRDLVGRDGELAGVVDAAYLDEVVSRCAGLAMIPDERLTTLPEVDFLKLGVDKPGGRVSSGEAK